MNYTVDSIVLAKQKYSTPWPSKVLNIEKKVLVHFFGDNRNGFVHPADIYDFALSMEALKLNLSSKPRSYLKGLKEAEMLLHVSAEISIFNN